MSEEMQPCRYEASALSSKSAVVAGFLPEPGVHEATCHSKAALEHD